MPKPKVPSARQQCSKCREPIWVAEDWPAEAANICKKPSGACSHGSRTNTASWQRNGRHEPSRLLQIFVLIFGGLRHSGGNWRPIPKRSQGSDGGLKNWKVLKNAKCSRRVMQTTYALTAMAI